MVKQSRYIRYLSNNSRIYLKKNHLKTIHRIYRIVAQDTNGSFLSWIFTKTFNYLVFSSFSTTKMSSDSVSSTDVPIVSQLKILDFSGTNFKTVVTKTGSLLTFTITSLDILLTTGAFAACLVKSLTSEATPSATQFFKRS